MFGKANEIKNPKGTAGGNVKPFSTYVNWQKEKLIKHVVRSDRFDPLRQLSFVDNTCVPFVYRKRRVGRPRERWAYTGLEAMHVRYGLGTNETFKQQTVTACQT